MGCGWGRWGGKNGPAAGRDAGYPEAADASELGGPPSACDHSFARAVAVLENGVPIMNALEDTKGRAVAEHLLGNRAALPAYRKSREYTSFAKLTRGLPSSSQYGPNCSSVVADYCICEKAGREEDLRRGPCSAFD